MPGCARAHAPRGSRRPRCRNLPEDRRPQTQLPPLPAGQLPPARPFASRRPYICTARPFWAAPRFARGLGNAMYFNYVRESETVMASSWLRARKDSPSARRVQGRGTVPSPVTLVPAAHNRKGRPSPHKPWVGTEAPRGRRSPKHHEKRGERSRLEVMARLSIGLRDRHVTEVRAVVGCVSRSAQG